MHHRIKLPVYIIQNFNPTMPPQKWAIHTIYNHSSVLFCFSVMCYDVYFRFETRYTFFVSVTPNVHIGIDNITQDTHIYIYNIELKQHQLFATLWFGELSEHLSCGREIKYFMYGKIIFLLHTFCQIYLCIRLIFE